MQSALIAVTAAMVNFSRIAINPFYVTGQEDLYLLELVRYIHLNPLRARLVKDLKELDTYAYGGHSVMMGKRKQQWQETDYILKFYDPKRLSARRCYRQYVQKGIGDGRKPDRAGRCIGPR